ncbi:DNA-3-methyladenine glycosylase family protein [Allorhodopirellula heiligendammensis]|uniref:DNA-3-methyladenine glycosylase II n=1 Tax=Allorhodopirellula heiligendammensis TaxID=2714739 RepID=A0A5C6C7S0_9BACT|nr:DNA-3-methyladenine glycosylase [Allorhodopirellula heiligendammensis]TWU19364.1 DNA-3-methyladenine glycosylase [Allorhodopirellula heiligendammensis]
MVNVSQECRNESAIKHLRRADPIMKAMIAEVGPCTLRPQRDRFRMLTGSIISQQISTGAARAIKKKLDELVGPKGLTPANLSRYSPDELRAAGVSPQKAKYLLDLAAKVHETEVNLQHMGRYSDDKIIEQLTTVKGIGKWTAQMFLIFSLGRPDVFPHDDLGVRSAIRNRYGLDELPDVATSTAIASKWRPYASIASWYCWQSLDIGKVRVVNAKD